MRASRSGLRPGRWPRKLRVAFEAIVTVFMNSYQAARSRAAGSPSKIVRLQAELDEANLRIGLLERELAIQRRRIEAIAPECRPRVLPDDRPQVLVLVEMLGLSLKQAAKRFVLHRNTISRWWRVLRGGKDPGGFLGAAPRFIVTDHGTQFLTRFERLLAPLASTDVVRCRVGDWHLAGKVERFFRTLKWWARRKLWAWFASRAAIARAIQRRLDAFGEWYNERPHQGLGGRTPNQAWKGLKRLKTKPIRAHDPQPEFSVTGDSHLPVVEVTVNWPEAA